MHDFFKANSITKEVVSKVRNVADKINKQNIKELFKHNSKPFPRPACETRWTATVLVLKSMLLVRDLLGQTAQTKKFLPLSDVEWLAVQKLTIMIGSLQFS